MCCTTVEEKDVFVLMNEMTRREKTAERLYCEKEKVMQKKRQAEKSRRRRQTPPPDPRRRHRHHRRGTKVQDQQRSWVRYHPTLDQFYSLSLSTRQLSLVVSSYCSPPFDSTNREEDGTTTTTTTTTTTITTTLSTRPCC